MDRQQDFMEKSTKSAKVFADIMPILENYFGGKILSTENQTSAVERLLDCDCGIDGIVKTDGAIFGIAHRVKYNNYTDFTIRLYNDIGKTSEIDHMRQSGFKPRYHVQTVCIDGTPTTIAIARTTDLVRAIDIELYTTKLCYNGAKFAVLDWNDLINNGINVDIIKL